MQWQNFSQHLYNSTDSFNLFYERKTLNVAFYFKILPDGSGESIMEFEWISNVLLGELNRPMKIINADEIRKNPRNDTLHVYLFHPDKNMFEKLKGIGFVNQGAFHMGDETMENKISYYPEVTYVFRNYYNAEYLSLYPNVHFAPLGTKSGFGMLSPHILLSSSQRRYNVNFIGSLRYNRQEMVDKVKNTNFTMFLSYDKQWAAKDAMHIIEYRNILRESMFTLAPQGNNPESLRLYEALEAGSIPIFQKASNNRSPMTPMGVQNPIPQFDTWDDAFKFIENILQNMNAVNELQKHVIQFWKLYKKSTQQKFKNVIDMAFKAAHGYNC